jgi:Arf-GAP/coiled-coil/ANK repeat/PH domain-containing protein
MQTQFSHQAIDYGYQINTIGCVKTHAIVDNLVSFMHSQFTFFHQGYDLLKEFDPFMRQVSIEVDRMRKESEAAIKGMDSRHSLVTPQHLQVCEQTVCMTVQRRTRTSHTAVF